VDEVQSVSKLHITWIAIKISLKNKVNFFLIRDGIQKWLVQYSLSCVNTFSLVVCYSPKSLILSWWFIPCDCLSLCGFLFRNFMCVIYVNEVMDNSRGVSEVVRVEDDWFSLSANH